MAAPFIYYVCDRCGCQLPSKRLPADRRQLQVYGLPDGWELTTDGERVHCTECVKDRSRRVTVPMNRRELLPR